MHQKVGLADQERVCIGARGFKLLGLKITEDVAVELVGAALGNHVHDAAESFAVLRFKATRLYLDFLNKVEIDTVAEGAIHAAVGAKTAKAGIGNVGAVDDVFV